MLIIVSKLSYMLNEEEIHNLDYYLKVSPKQIKKAFGFDENYYQFVKRYLQSIQKYKYEIKDIYKQKLYKNSSRIYGVGQTLQSLSSDIISMIFGDTSFDIDMVNASFYFLKYINDKFFKMELLFIADYCINRKDYFDKDHDKQFFISALFHSNTKQLVNPTNSKKQNDLLNEIHSLKINICENLDKFNLTFDEGLHSGQKLVKIIHHYESKLLSAIIPDFSSKTKALKHDGFIIDNSVDIEEALKYCNKKGEEYGVKFINKPFNEVPTFIEETTPEYSEKSTEYIQMKTEFEKNRFMVLNPLMYFEEDNGIPIEYTKKDFKDIVKPFQLNDKDFFDEWLKDKERRTYKTISWTPSLKNIDETAYNYFKGFPATLISDYNEEKEQQYIKPFLHHIMHLCGDDDQALKYVVNYIAHLIQKPCERPDTFIIMASEEGTGKDRLIDIIEKIIGKDLCMRESNMNHITGNFNDGLEHKLLLQMNEIDGKDGHGFSNAIKDLITRDTHNINKKYGKKKNERNYLRGFAFFNGLNSMKVQSGSRRFMVCKSNDPKPKAYYDKLSKLINNNEAINYIYTYLFTYDISKWSSRKIPKTDYFNALASRNTDPIYNFIHDILKNPNDYNIKVKKEFGYIGQNAFKLKYEAYMNENDYKLFMNKKAIDLLLNREGIIKKRINLKNEQKLAVYKLPFTLLEKYDNKYGKEDDIEEVDFSDDELEFIEDLTE